VPAHHIQNVAGDAEHAREVQDYGIHHPLRAVQLCVGVVNVPAENENACEKMQDVRPTMLFLKRGKRVFEKTETFEQSMACLLKTKKLMPGAQNNFDNK
jgi:hypothetical protein